MDGNHKRKLDDFSSAESEDGESESEDERCSTERDEEEISKCAVSEDEQCSGTSMCVL